MEVLADIKVRELQAREWYMILADRAEFCELGRRADLRSYICKTRRLVGTVPVDGLMFQDAMKWDQRLSC